MPESITKYAINSTLGTGEFQPLDKIIKGQRYFAASDTTIAILGSAGTVTYLPKSFIPKTNGVVKLTADFEYGTLGGDGLDIFEDGNLYATTKKDTEISVKKNSVYTFKTKSGTSVSDLKICAQIIDGSLFEIQDNE